jgi:predicted RecB family endonuclease
MILQDDFRSAFEVLISTPLDSPSFSLSVLKAGIADSPGYGQNLAACVGALISGGELGDAIDLLMLTRRFKEAARALVNEGNVELVVQMNRTVLDETDDWMLLEQVVKLLLTENNWRTAVEILIAFRLFERAGDVLRNEGFTFPGDVIGSLTKDFSLGQSY